MSKSGDNQFPKALTASNKGTFAYYTVKDRLPITITKAIDTISRFRNDIVKRYSEDVIEDTKTSVEKLAQLRYEVTTDKPLRRIDDSGEDLDLWNRSIDELEKEIGVENCTWFKAPWLFSECYVYRRIREAMITCSSDLKHYDPFEHSKLETHNHNLNSVFQLICATCPLDFENEKLDQNLLHKRFSLIMEALLWSNKNDLSLSSGENVSDKVKNLVELLDSFQENIICDESNLVWRYLNELKEKNSKGEKISIDIVLDNCSIELASDFVFCDFLLRNEFVSSITLHAKAYSWFISDVTEKEFDLLLKQLQSSNSIVVNNFLKRFKAYLSESKIKLEHNHQFWTSPYSFDKMPKIAPELYRHFCEESSLVFLKGDLNYRKLIGDLDWPFNTELKKATRDFQPTGVCAIRTLKADLLAGVDLNNERYLSASKKFDEKNKWMVTGDYGVIQFYSN